MPEPSPTAVTLRPVEDDDLPEFFEHQRDPDARWAAAFTASDPDDRRAFDAHWAKLRADDTVRVRTILADGAVAGHVASFLVGDQREVTYWIDRRQWGRGIATAALEALLAEDDTRPMYAAAAADNGASLRVLEKCGFVKCAEAVGFAAAREEEIAEIILRLDAT